MMDEDSEYYNFCGKRLSFQQQNSFRFIMTVTKPRTRFRAFTFFIGRIPNMKWIMILLQVCILTIMMWIGNEVSLLFHIPIPGSITGMILLFLLLKLRVIKLHWVEVGGTFLLNEMLLFFIPPVVGVMQYTKLMRTDGLQFLVVIIISTILVMTTTGIVAEQMARKRGVAK